MENQNRAKRGVTVNQVNTSCLLSHCCMYAVFAVWYTALGFQDNQFIYCIEIVIVEVFQLFFSQSSDYNEFCIICENLDVNLRTSFLSLSAASKYVSTCVKFTETWSCITIMRL